MCPETGRIELYFEQTVGDRPGGVAYATIPAARLRGRIEAVGTTFSNYRNDMLILAHGANRGVGIACQASDFYMMLNALAPGTFRIRIAHRE